LKCAKEIEQNQKLTKYLKKFKINPNLTKDFQIMLEVFKKRQKTKKIKINSPSASSKALGEETPFPEC
jgi:hypothetical protein